jgi:hypothetical protein
VDRPPPADPNQAVDGYYLLVRPPAILQDKKPGEWLTSEILSPHSHQALKSPLRLSR